MNGTPSELSVRIAQAFQEGRAVAGGDLFGGGILSAPEQVRPELWPARWQDLDCAALSASDWNTLSGAGLRRYLPALLTAAVGGEIGCRITAEHLLTDGLLDQHRQRQSRLAAGVLGARQGRRAGAQARNGAAARQARGGRRMSARIDSRMTREPVAIAPRGITAARRARLIARDGGQCRYPGCPATSGLELDHIVARALGGRDSDDNLETLCPVHHLQKTRQDARLIAKARRAGAKHRGEFPPSKAKLRSRRFPPTRDWRDDDEEG